MFSRCNPFPSWPSAAQDTYSYYYSTSGIILNKRRPLFLGFHWYKYVFWLFTATLKMVTEPLKEGTREVSVLFPMPSILIRELLKTVCFDCEMPLFWQNILKAVCFGQNVFFLGTDGKNCRFWQNSLTYWDFVMVIFRFLGQNGLKLELRTFAVHKILMEH